MRRIFNAFFYYLKRLFCYHLYTIKWCNSVLSKQKINFEKKELKKKSKIYKKKWGALSKLVSDKYFRIFAPYTNYNIDVVPEDVLHHIMEPILNPYEYQALYEDKNYFSKFLPPSFLPKEILRCMNGFFYSGCFERVRNDSVMAYLRENCCGGKRYILKPTVNSCSGRGIVFFEKKEKDLKLVGDEESLGDYINRMEGKNFVIQECLSQSPFMLQFNNTSINTIRVCVYKSALTNESHVTAAIMRIGRKDSLIDNAHAGGVFVGVSLEGRIGKYVVDQYGVKNAVFNGIDFSKAEFIIPHFDRVVAFSKEVADKCVHHKLFALDVMINEQGNPILIEYNLTAFSSWLFEFTGVSPFGPYTDEIIDFCAKNKKNKRIYIV